MPQNRNNTCQERFLYNRERELRNLADFAKRFIVFTFFPRDVLGRKSDLAKLSTESFAQFADFSPECGGCKRTRIPCTKTRSQWARVRVEEERHGEKTNRDYKMLKTLSRKGARQLKENEQLRENVYVSLSETTNTAVIWKTQERYKAESGRPKNPKFK